MCEKIHYRVPEVGVGRVGEVLLRLGFSGVRRMDRLQSIRKG